MAYKTIRAFPRKLLYAQEFCGPSSTIDALKQFENESILRNSLRPYISRKIDDSKYDDWNIHHFPSR